jgi:hypothetical protein
LATSSCLLETLFATKAQETPSIPPSTTIAALAKQIACHRRENKQRGSRKYVITSRSIHWKMGDYFFEPFYARFDFTHEECVDDEGLAR